MDDLTISASIKDFFFDAAKVVERAEAAQDKVLSKAGAFIRKSARGLLRRRKTVSSPGSPPSVHTEDKYATLKNILFGSPAPGHLVVGPISLKAKSAMGRPAPNAQEFGGTVSRIKWEAMPRNMRPGVSQAQRDAYGRAIRSGRLPPPPRIPVVTTLTLSPRPFMGPSFTQNVDKFPEMWRGAVSDG